MSEAVSTQRKAEFARLLAENQSRLYGYIHSLIPDLSHVDDLFQQTALVLWDKFDAFDRDRSFFSWACGVARYEAANYSRRLARQRRFFGHELNLLLIAAHEDLSDAEMTDRRVTLTQCVEKLREPDRALLAECYADAGGVPGAAARRNRSTHSIYNSLRRIRQQLYNCIKRALAQ